jgi:hypothetical protein
MQIAVFVTLAIFGLYPTGRAPRMTSMTPNAANKRRTGSHAVALFTATTSSLILLTSYFLLSKIPYFKEQMLYTGSLSHSFLRLQVKGYGITRFRQGNKLSG